MADLGSLYTPPAAAMGGEPEPAECRTRNGSWLRVRERTYLTRGRILLLNALVVPVFSATAMVGGALGLALGDTGAWLGCYVGLFGGVMFAWGPLLASAVVGRIERHLGVAGRGGAVRFIPRLPTSPSRLLDFNDSTGVVEVRADEIAFRGDGVELLVRRDDVRVVEAGPRSLLGGDFARAPTLILAEPLGDARSVTILPRGARSFVSATRDTWRLARELRAWHAGAPRGAAAD